VSTRRLTTSKSARTAPSRRNNPASLQPSEYRFPKRFSAPLSASDAGSLRRHELQSTVSNQRNSHLGGRERKKPAEAYFQISEIVSRFKSLIQKHCGLVFKSPTQKIAALK
jgi:hypothetical protein